MAEARERHLASRFLENARIHAARPALHIGGKFYSYPELLSHAEQVFSSISKSPVTRLVGIYCTDSAWTYAAIIAVLSSGSAYVPLNPKFSPQRLRTMSEYMRLEAIVTDVPLPFDFSGQTIMIDEGAKAVPLALRRKPDVAYVLYTSGSTGQPKAVPVSHASICAFFDHYDAHYDFDEKDRFLQPYELSFDVSVFSTFAAWNAGACTYVVPSGGFRYLNIPAVIRDHRITVTSMVPTVLIYLEKYLPSFTFGSVRYSFFCGDRLLEKTADAWHRCTPNAKLVNSYGPTELTIVCTEYHWSANSGRDREATVTIGKPFAGMRCVFRDESGNFSENGPGEILFAGPLSIENYLFGADEERFVNVNGSKMFCTGDVGFLNDDGEIEFIGRYDSQVKVDGYRVELAEVERALRTVCEGNVAVLAVGDNGLNKLIAFVESRGGDQRPAVPATLAPYMHPAEFIFMQELPLNINGKTDRAALNRIYHERHIA